MAEGNAPAAVAVESHGLSASPATVLRGLDPAKYPRSLLHAESCVWVEKNCYVDIWIEVIHALGLEPRAILPFVAAIDFEGDQWTFFKPPPDDVERLFGIDIHEMQPYRPLPQQIAEQISQGRTIIVELDSWFMPDTAATSYRAEHLKTTIVPEAIDRGAERLRYLHNAGLYELSGEDYRGCFRMLPHFTDDVMDPFTELVRFDVGPRLSGDELRATALEPSL